MKSHYDAEKSSSTMYVVQEANPPRRSVPSGKTLNEFGYAQWSVDMSVYYVAFTLQFKFSYGVP
jgi:hypothetical protein